MRKPREDGTDRRCWGEHDRRLEGEGVEEGRTSDVVRRVGVGGGEGGCCIGRGLVASESNLACEDQFQNGLGMAWPFVSVSKRL